MTVEARLESIERKLDRILNTNRRKAPVWVKISFVKKLTGWSKEDMRKARENGLIKQRRGNNGIEYLLESIDEKFIKKATL